MRNKYYIPAAIIIALFLIVPKTSGQDLMDVMVSLKNLDKKLNELEAVQKKDVQKLQTQLAMAGGTTNTPSMDTLKSTVTDLQNAVKKYASLDSSLISLAGRFDNLEKELSTARSTPQAGPELASKDLIAELKNLTGELKEVIKDRPAEPTKPAAPAENKSAISGFDMKLYGFVKLEAIYDNSEVVKGDWMLYANKGDSPQSKQEVYTMNARHSRLGLKIGGPAVGKSGKVNALVEVDFAGGFPNTSTAARQPILNLRHSWLELTFPRWQARFGQDWALISGPFPNTTSFVVNGGAGNLWMRYPQICVTLKAQPMKFAMSINRPIAGNVKYEEFASSDLDPVDDGERSGYPWFMSRVWFSKGNHTASVSGHFGQELINDLSGKGHHMNSNSINTDIVSKFGRFGFTARAFYGENLNSFLGGVLQGYVNDSTSVHNIAAVGGWSQLSYDFSSMFSSNVGFGIDDPINSRLKTGMRSQNHVMYANVIFKIQKAVELILESEHLTTSYLNARTGKNLRFQFASYLKF